MQYRSIKPVFLNEINNHFTLETIYANIIAFPFIQFVNNINYDALKSRK